ncbi:MAG: acyltransferase family protein [Oceanidesulfovibrio sp.]
MNGAPERLHYIDNLRVFLSVLVIVHHCAGAWTIGNSPIQDTATSMPLNILCGVNASFFMGAFFLVSGYFHPPTLHKKGMRRFILDRFQRLALPALVYGCTVMPLTGYWLHFYVQDHGTPPGLFEILPRYFSEQFGFGHLWFVVMLFVFSIAYALIAGASKARQGDTKTQDTNGSRLQLGLALLTAVLFVVTFVVRVWYPQNTWVEFPWPISFEPAHLPQYAIMFAVGVYAFHSQLFARLGPRTGVAWTALGIVPTLALAPVFMADAFLGSGVTLAGGISALREAFMCVGLCVGLVVLFRYKCNRTGGLLRFLSRNAYAAYIVHMPLVYALQYLVIPWQLDPVAKFLVVATAAVPAAFVTAGLITRIPGVKRVL